LLDENRGYISIFENQKDPEHKTEKEARNFAETFISQHRVKMLEETKSKMSLDDLFNQIQEGNLKELNIVVKADVQGSVEAIKQSLIKLSNEEVVIKIIHGGVGAINESDIKMAGIDKDSVIVGFSANIDNTARDLNESMKVKIETFDIIYKLIDWLRDLIEERRPRKEIDEVIGSLKILKTFGSTKDKHVIGGKVTTGKIGERSCVKIKRRDFEIGCGKIVELQTNKIKAKEVFEGDECGVQIETKIELATGDVLEAFEKVIK
jgi:translation initiation factor IF-2